MEELTGFHEVLHGVCRSSCLIHLGDAHLILSLISDHHWLLIEHHLLLVEGHLRLRLHLLALGNHHLLVVGQVAICLGRRRRWRLKLVVVLVALVPSLVALSTSVLMTSSVPAATSALSPILVVPVRLLLRELLVVEIRLLTSLEVVVIMAVGLVLRTAL